MKYGLELEAFLYNEKDELVTVPAGIPADSCGWLVEYRGAPANSIHEAVGLLLAEEHKVQHLLEAMKLSPRLIPFAKVPRKVKLEARRRFTKGLLEYQNLYGLSPTKADTAGLHISFTLPAEVRTEGGHARTFNLLWDFPTLFRALDKEYSKEIREAHRKPGFYEIKPDRRIEYRSLPNTVNLWDVADFIAAGVRCSSR